MCFAFRDRHADLWVSKVDAEGRIDAWKQTRLFSNGFVVWIGFAGDRRLERTPVEDVRQATTRRAVGSANHVYADHIKMAPPVQCSRKETHRTQSALALRNHVHTPSKHRYPSQIQQKHGKWTKVYLAGSSTAGLYAGRLWFSDPTPTQQARQG